MTFKSFFKDKKGNIVIIQKPNLLIIIAVIFFLVQLLFANQIENLAVWGFKLTLLVWSFDEALRGDSPFRKVLGIFTGVYIIVTIILQLIN